MTRGKSFGLKPVLIILFFLIVLPLRLLFAQIETYTDTPLWRQALGGAVIGHPVAMVESVVVVTDGGRLRSYSSQGRPLWDFNARGRLTPHVSRSREGTSYIGRTNGLLIAVNRAGRELWRIQLGSPIVFPVISGWDGRLFVFTEERIICKTAAGFTLWSRDLGSRTALAPIMDVNGGIILVQEDGVIHNFDPFGNVVSYIARSTREGSSAAAPVAAASVKIEGRGPAIFLLYEDRHLELVFTSPQYTVSGSNERSPQNAVFLRELIDLPSPPLAATGRNGEAAVLMRDGRVALLCLNENRILWTTPSHIRAGELPSRPSSGDLNLFYDERGIYILTRTGATGFTSDGRRLWTVRLRGAASIPAFGDDGILYSGGADWILNAYRLEERVRARPRLLFGEAPLGTYGTGNPGPSTWANFHFRFQEMMLEERFAQIRQAIRTGNVGANEKEYAAWLMETSGSFLTNPHFGNRPPVHAHHRAEAARLLGFIGSRETIPFLANLFRNDPSDLVKTAAAEAIGRIGVDPEGIALRAFETALFPIPSLRYEATLTATAAAIGALCRFSGPPLSEAGVRLLTRIAADYRIPAARNQARRELMSLR